MKAKYSLLNAIFIILCISISTPAARITTQYRSRLVSRTLVWRGIKHNHTFTIHLSDDSNDLLLSAIGPILSKHIEMDQITETGGWITEYISVNYLEGYKFSLSRYLDESGQAGKVIAKIMKYKLNGQQLSELAQSKLTFEELKNELKQKGYIKETAWNNIEQPDNFYVNSWDGVNNVCLTIQTWHPEGMRSANRLESVDVAIRAPDEWIPWLKAASAGNGIFYDDLYHWEHSLSPRQFRVMHDKAAKSSPVMRRKLIREIAYPRKAWISAIQLSEEFFPASVKHSSSLEVKRAWTDRMHIIATEAYTQEDGLDFVAKLYDQKWPHELGLVVLHDIERYLNALGPLRSISSEQKFKDCYDASDPFICSKPIFEKARAFSRSIILKSTCE